MKDDANLRSGFYGSLALGNRPALVIVDFQRGFTEAGLTPLSSPCEDALAATNRLIKVFRGKGPIIHTVVSYHPSLLDGGYWPIKCSSLKHLVRNTPACEVDPRLDFAPDSDLVLHKTHASAFFGTPLASLLTSAGINSVVIAGMTTSGCIRATAVDAMQYGFPPFVIRDCVADRSEQQHESNLIDIESKYGEVLDLDTFCQQLAQLD